MDVVRSKVEGIGGSVDVESAIGAGTTWRMRIPLTLAIMPALTVECGGEVFAIAQVNLLELVAIRSGEEGPRIEWVGDAPVFRLRGSLLPLVPLADVLGLDPGEDDLVIAVMQVDDERFGLMVDRVLNTEEIVVKALSSRVKQLGLFSGATVLGDGTVALILDLQAVARQALGTDAGDLVRTRSPQTVPPEAAETRLERLLVVGAAGGRRVGVPLEVVTRLERLPADSVERVGSREVLQYRGALVPLVRLDDVLGTGSAGDADDLPVVVVATGRGGSLALAVDQILDVVDHDPSERSEVRDTALVASTVIDGQVTELLDLPALIRSAEPVQAFDLERMGA
jgi:two-component system chemotaxis sensor kinase CheA